MSETHIHPAHVAGVLASVTRSLINRGLVASHTANDSGDMGTVHYPDNKSVGRLGFVLAAGRWSTVRYHSWEALDAMFPLDETERAIADAAETSGRYSPISSPLDGLTIHDPIERVADTIADYVSPAPRPLGFQFPSPQRQQTLPLRVVDRFYQGWRAAFPGEQDAYPVYVPTNGGIRRIGPMQYAALESLRGPTLVVSDRITPATRDWFVQQLLNAGNKAVRSLAVAAARAAALCGKDETLRSPSASVLVCGNENSPESGGFLRMIEWADDWGRQASAPAKRINERTVAAFDTHLYALMLARGVQLDVPAVVQDVFAALIDRLASELPLTRGRRMDNVAAWRAVADQYLQPSNKVSAHRSAGVYHFLMERSDFYDPYLWD